MSSTHLCPGWERQVPRVNLGGMEIYLNKGSYSGHKEASPNLHLSNAFCALGLKAWKLRAQSADALETSS